MKKARYFVAIVIPEPIASEVCALQEFVAAHYESRAALRSPPHITLVPPFSAEDCQIDHLYKTIRSISNTMQSGVQLALDGFDVFGKRVIFVHVKPNRALTDIVDRTSRVLRHNGFAIKEERREYHPHVTIAFKDLKPMMFNQAWSYLSTIKLKHIFTVQSLALLCHRDGRWHILQTFDVGKELT
ncbi:MAG TPA: 2'-5' RNA ligase family protein [Saprospiraceae bacterium]|nr:2'-5' RNA ligase family protein [Saprospiraceae bacterium]